MQAWVIAALLLVACKKDDPGPTCVQVVDHVLDVTKQTLPGHEAAGALGDRKASIAQCETRKLSADARRCLLAAKDLDGFGACYKTVPRPPPPPPPSSGSSVGSAGSN